MITGGVPSAEVGNATCYHFFGRVTSAIADQYYLT